MIYMVPFQESPATKRQHIYFTVKKVLLIFSQLINDRD